MRNFVIAFLVLFLPLQWGATVLAEYCLHEESPAVAQYIGQYAHHNEYEDTTLKADGGQEGKACDASCIADHEHCHCTHATAQESRLPSIVASGTVSSPYAAAVPDAPLDSLLRPPPFTLA